MNVINPAAGLPDPLYAAIVIYQTRAIFAIFYDSHLPNTNCYQFTDPGRMEGLVGLSNDKLSNLLRVAKKIVSWLGGIEPAT